MKARVKPSTCLSCEAHAHRHINPDLGKVPLHKLPPAALDAFYGTLITQPRKPVEQSTQRNKSKSKSNSKPKPEEETKKEQQRAEPPLSPLTVRKILATLHTALNDADPSHEKDDTSGWIDCLFSRGQSARS